MDFTQIRFWPFMADTFVEITLRGVQHIAGHTIYAARYAGTGEGVESGAIKLNQIDQSIRALYGYAEGGWSVYEYRMGLQVYFGVPPMAEAVMPEGLSEPVTEDELEEMICHNGQWYTNDGTLKRALEDAAYQATKELWAIPTRMLEPKPTKPKTRPKRRWIV